MKVQSQFIEMFKHKKPNGKIADLVDANIKSVKKSFNKEDMIEYIDISSVNAKYRTLNETTQYIVASAPSRAQQCVQNGDILVSTVRPINRNVAVVNSNLTSLVASTGFCVLRPIDGYREYLLAIVTSDKYTEKMCDIASGGLYPAVNNSDVLSYDIFIPDKDFLHRVTQIYQQADKSKFVGFKSQFIEMFAFQDLSLTNPSDDFGKKCYDDTSSATKVPAGDYQNKGRYAIYDQSQDCDIAGYTDSIEGVCNNYPAVLFGDHSRVIKYINQPFYIGADGVKIIRPKEDDLLPEFLYYDLLYHNIPNTGYNRHFKYVKMFKLTEVSIDEQKEFLKIAHQADKSKYYYQIA